MATYKCLADLQGKTLEYGDIVILKDIKYKVSTCFLREDCADNDKIFRILSIPSKEEFATSAYGYECFGGNWPSCKSDDYEALTRLVKELYKIIESPVIGFKIKGSYIRHLNLKEAIKLFKGYSVCFDENKWAFDSTGWYYWNIQDFQLHYNEASQDPGSKYRDVTPGDNPNHQWYKSEIGVYVWTKNKQVDVFVAKDVRKDAIEVSPTTKITTIKQEEKHENQFQRKKARIERGTRPEGSTVCGRRGKASVAVGHLGYRKVTGI